MVGDCAVCRVQRTVGSVQWAAGGGRRAAGGMRQAACGGRRVAGGGRRVACGVRSECSVQCVTCGVNSFYLWHWQQHH